jgi:ATP-dependent Lon protease
MPTTLSVGREKSVLALEAVEAVPGRFLALFMQKDPSVEDPGALDLHQIGTVVRVLKTLHHKDKYHVVVEGVARIIASDWVHTEPYLKAHITTHLEPKDALVRDAFHEQTAHVRKLAYKLFKLNKNLPPDVLGLLNTILDPATLCDLVTAISPFDSEDRQEVLATFEVRDRLALVIALLEKNISMHSVLQKVDDRTQEEITKNQKEYYLREKIRAIRKELGDDEEAGDEDDFDSLKDRIVTAKMPPEVEKAAIRELRRLKKMSPQASEYSVTRTYIDWLLDLPWDKSTDDNLDLNQVIKILDEDHFGLEKAKDRILEYLAVCKLKKDMKSPILCFVGPPGVGKTSLAKSIARALGRETVRVSLGGVRDEAEMRGHRRTYVGAMPGQIIKGFKKAGTNNPVMILDEIDKISSDHRGDPAGALLEILDPEQNNSFRDHYLDLPFDLSKTLFVTTANSLSTIRKPLLDRLEILEVSGYTMQEKVEIAKGYIIKKQLEDHGLTEDHLEIEDGAIRHLIEGYTREGGVRSLQREVGSVFRRIAKEVAMLPEGSKYIKRTITKEMVEDIRGPIRFTNDVAERTSVPGVVTGMAWTAVGGDILFIEATMMPGTGKLKLSGNLGDVMKESIGVAESYVRAIAKDLGIPKEVFSENDIHVHIPAGATPKDGPSAGITMLTAIVSLLTDIPVHHELAMTGEASLRGAVLQVGGIKEKVMAAHRAGIRMVLLPEKNEKDWPELPQEIRDDMIVHFVSRMEDVLKTALGPDKLEAFKKSED